METKFDRDKEIVKGYREKDEFISQNKTAINKDKLKMQLKFLSLIGPTMITRLMEYIWMEQDWRYLPSEHVYFKKRSFIPPMDSKTYNDEIIGFPIATNYQNQTTSYLFTDGIFRIFDQEQKFIMELNSDLETNDKEFYYMTNMMFKTVNSYEFDVKFKLTNSDRSKFDKMARKITG